MSRRASSHARGRQNRTEQERARRYAARAAWQEGRAQRRRRDTVIASIAGSALVIAAFVSQAVHASVAGPVPEPTTTPSPAPIVTPTLAPSAPAPDFCCISTPPVLLL